MWDFVSIIAYLNEHNVTFDEIHFLENDITGTLTRENNFNPENEIKTHLVETNTGTRAVIIRAKDIIDRKKLETVIGAWKELSKEKIMENPQIETSRTLPLMFEKEILIDRHVVELDVWSMRAGDLNKGVNIKKSDALNNLKYYNVVSVV